MSPIFDPDEVSGRWPGIPPLILQGMARYFNVRLPVGGFLDACLRNDLADAVMHADLVSFLALRSIVGALLEGPVEARGSATKVARWLEVGRAMAEQGGRR